MVSRWQLYLLTVNYTLGTTLFVLLQTLVKQGGTNAWLLPWWGGAFGIFFALIWIHLCRCYPGLNLVQIPMRALGRPAGVVVLMLYFLFFSMLASWILRNLSDYVNSTILPETPMSVIHLIFLSVVCYTVAQGVETIARLNQALTPFLFFPFWFILLLATMNWDWTRLQPAFRSDIVTKMMEMDAFLGFPYMEVVAIATLSPLVAKGAGRALVLGIATASLSLSLILFMIVGLMGVERASRLTFPLYSVVQEVALGDVIINIHSVVSVILLILIFIKLSVAVYGAYETLNQAFHPSTKWVLLFLWLMLAAMANSIYENPIQNGEWSEKYTFFFHGFFGVFIPGVLLIATWIRRLMSSRGRSAD